ncbi:MAG: hypothetical protein GVY11_06485 [Gammaproteobacteria bacterium]|nr:hypothetical protein [Gammaproteobacteria bacterium]
MRILFLTLVLILPSASQASPADDFWSRLQALCGEAFEGELIEAPEGENGFAGKRLLMHVRECSEQRIRIPFVVGEDRSRTWVLTRHDDRIELRHDHRHADGTPDEITMYGGASTNAGRPDVQYFPADERTRRTIEAAFSNVWMMRIEPGETFSYGLRRLGTSRVFRIDFDLSDAVDPPPAPWGWEAGQ